MSKEQGRPNIEGFLALLSADPEAKKFVEPIKQAIARGNPEDQRLVAALHDLWKQFECNFVFRLEVTPEGWYVLGAGMNFNGFIRINFFNLNTWSGMMEYLRPKRQQMYYLHDLNAEPLPLLTIDPNCPDDFGGHE